MSSTKPIIVLVHGNWHSPEHFELLNSNLSQHGYKINSIWLPSIHYSRLDPPLHPAAVDLPDDISAVRETVLSELASHPDTDVIVLCHSYGTVPASAALENLDKASRVAQGFSNGVNGLLIIAGILPPAGKSMLEFAGTDDLPTVTRTSIPDPSDSTKSIQVTLPRTHPDPVPLFYHDVADPEEAKRYASLCSHQVWSVNQTRIPFTAWAVPGMNVFYLLAEEDRALPPMFQRLMIDDANKQRAEASAALNGQNAQEIQVTSIQSSHSPFLSRVEETAQWVRRCGGEEM